MSFWSEAAPVSKGLIMFGLLGLLYLGIARVASLPPFGVSMPDDLTQSQTRGIEPQ